MTASERIRAARVEKDKALVSALDQNPVETREVMSYTYELRVNHSDGYSFAKINTSTIDAASFKEAVRRASHIWPGTTSVQLHCIIDRKPQDALAFGS